jgi:hypothetical protein
MTIFISGNNKTILKASFIHVRNIQWFAFYFRKHVQYFDMTTWWTHFVTTIKY